MCLLGNIYRFQGDRGAIQKPIASIELATTTSLSPQNSFDFSLDVTCYFFCHNPHSWDGYTQYQVFPRKKLSTYCVYMILVYFWICIEALEHDVDQVRFAVIAFLILIARNAVRTRCRHSSSSVRCPSGCACGRSRTGQHFPATAFCRCGWIARWRRIDWGFCKVGSHSSKYQLAIFNVRPIQNLTLHN